MQGRQRAGGVIEAGVLGAEPGPLLRGAGQAPPGGDHGAGEERGRGHLPPHAPAGASPRSIGFRVSDLGFGLSLKPSVCAAEQSSEQLLHGLTEQHPYCLPKKSWTQAMAGLFVSGKGQKQESVNIAWNKIGAIITSAKLP